MYLNAKNRSEKGLRCTNPCKSGDGSYLKKLTSPPKGGGVEVGILGGQKIKSPGNVMNCPEIQFVLPIPPRGGFRGGFGGSKFQKSGQFHELSRKSIKKITPPPPKGVAVGILGGQKIKSPGNVTNCREK